MSRRLPFSLLVTKLPRRSKLVLATAVVGMITNYVGRKTIRGMEDANLAANMERIRERPPNWSCFYYAKQYREECSDYNRMLGGEYMEEVCTKLENRMEECKRRLLKEIEGSEAYAMDLPARISGRKPWLTTHDVSKSF
ncbi:hypothetical protein BgAZ_500950 [Babesia gibsoni]|uniref:Uncharacterized protein n=1 Tax=Babesia gibsoni TaxID=33632 RepID=A0AAD8LI25_BABGI|nr:hypothetical protein BgAZ_500950 [Babesia gibsoni]